jgi:hypothetical protein
VVLALAVILPLGRLGGNATGVNFFRAELVAKRLGLLRELLSQASRVASLRCGLRALRPAVTVLPLRHFARQNCALGEDAMHRMSRT